MNEQAKRLSLALEEGPQRIGQLCLWKSSDGGYRLCHERDYDDGRADFDRGERVEEARDLAKFASDGSFRVLKTARDLRSGWMMCLSTVEALARAVDQIYPAALGQWLALEQGRIRVVPLRETLGRQTGKYRQAGRITDAGLRTVVEARCCASCLRRILWQESGDWTAGVSHGIPEGSIPLICSEACHLLVADAQAVAAGEQAGEGRGVTGK